MNAASRSQTKVTLPPRLDFYLFQVPDDDTFYSECYALKGVARDVALKVLRRRLAGDAIFACTATIPSTWSLIAQKLQLASHAVQRHMQQNGVHQPNAVLNRPSPQRYWRHSLVRTRTRRAGGCSHLSRQRRNGPTRSRGLTYLWHLHAMTQRAG